MVDKRPEPSSPVFQHNTKRQLSPSEAQDNNRPAPKKRLLSQAPRASQACQSCAASKVRCDDLTTCRRCIKRGMPCIRSAAFIRDHTRLSGIEASNVDSPAVRSSTTRETFDCHQNETGTVDGEGDLFDREMRGALASMSVEGLNPCVSLNSPPQTLGDEHGTSLLFDEMWTGFSPLDTSLIEATDWLKSSSLNADLDPSFLLPVSFFELRHNDDSFTISDAAMQTPESLYDRDKAGFEQAVKAHAANLGSWKPTTEDYLSTSKAVICTPLDRPDLTDSALGNFDSKIINGALSSARRDEIVVAMSEGATSSQALLAARTFPSTEVLDKLVRVFLTRERSSPSDFVHLPTFDISSCSLYFLIACIVAGAALSPTQSVRNFGLGLCDVLRYHVIKMAEHDNYLYRDISYIQTLSILSEVGLWSGDQRMSEQSDTSSQIAASSLRHSGCFSPDAFVDYATLLREHGNDLSQAWGRWIQKESFKRTAFKHLILCTQRSAVRNMPPQICPFELHAPIPEDARIWSAESATEWQELYVRFHSPSGKNRINIPSAFASIPTLDLAPDSQAFKLVDLSLLYSFLSMLVEDRRREHAFRGRRSFGWGFADYSQLPMLNNQVSLYLELRHTIDANPHRSSPAVVTFLSEYNVLFSSTPLHLSNALLSHTEQRSSSEIFSQLQDWQQTRSSRRAIWYAGQVVRACRAIPGPERTCFHCFGVYQALLCLWTYWTATKLKSNKSPVTSILDGNMHPIHLDGPETLESQRWINHNAGVPFLRRSHEHTNSNSTVLDLFAIDATGQQEPKLALVDVLAECFDCKLVGRHIPLLKSASMVLQALERV